MAEVRQVDAWEFWSDVAQLAALKVSGQAKAGGVGDRLIGGERIAVGAQRLQLWANRLISRSTTAEERYLAQVAGDARRRIRGAPADIDDRCYAVLRSVAPFYRLGIIDDDPAPVHLVVEKLMEPWRAEEAAEIRQQMAMEDGEFPVEPRDDGGIVSIGHGGMLVVFRSGYTVSTFDDSALTRLTLAAHRWCCRVELGFRHDPFHDGTTWGGIQARSVGMTMLITPRDRTAIDNFSRHPSLADLARAVRWPTRQTLEGP